jgi:hypothetical protein
MTKLLRYGHADGKRCRCDGALFLHVHDDALALPPVLVVEPASLDSLTARARTRRGQRPDVSLSTLQREVHGRRS